MHKKKQKKRHHLFAVVKNVGQILNSQMFFVLFFFPPGKLSVLCNTGEKKNS